MTSPTSPIELAGTDNHFPGPSAPLPPELLDALSQICPTDSSVSATAEASRDWWPIALHWALVGEVPRRAAAVVRPRDTAQVVAVVQLCNRHRVPLTVAGGRSGVCGASVPLFGGIVMDITALSGICSVDVESGVVEVLPGTFGPDLEAELQERHGLTVGHFPQSFDISTVGGWVACRGAGQYSTRYGKIEDIVVGLEVVLADGRIIVTGGSPAAAAGADLSQLFVGSEGTLGVITRVWLKAHPVPPAEQRAAFSFMMFEDGIEACRRIIRRGATPAVLRLYDADEAKRSHGADGFHSMLLVMDEGDELLVTATMAVVADVCDSMKAEPLPVHHVEDWMNHRNDTAALQKLTKLGLVVDTMEIAAPWSRLPTIFAEARGALMQVAYARTATAHLSHSYTDGACLYFTFAANPPPESLEATYVDMWNAGQRAVLAAGGNLSHHHGIGLNRGRFMAEALGVAHSVMTDVKAALDPMGILNPGKLGLPSFFGGAPAPYAADLG